MNQDLKNVPVVASQPDVASPQEGTFLELFCRRHRCPPAVGKRKILWRCQHYPALTLLARMLYLLKPKIFRLDLGLISQVGHETDAHRVSENIKYSDAFDQYHPHTNFFRQTLGLRLSRRKLIALAHEIFDESQSP